MILSDAAHAVDIPELTIPILDITLFEDSPPGAASPSPSVEPVGQD